MKQFKCGDVVLGCEWVTRKEIDDCTTFVARYGAKGLAYVKVNEKAKVGNVTKHVSLSFGPVDEELARHWTIVRCAIECVWALDDDNPYNTYVIEGLPIDEFSQACINKTLKELTDEQAGVAHLL